MVGRGRALRSGHDVQGWTGSPRFSSVLPVSQGSQKHASC